MRITGLSALIIVTCLMASCSFNRGRGVPPPPLQTQTQSEGPTVRAIPVTKVEAEAVISPQLCAQAKNSDAAAQNIIATYYDSVVDVGDLTPDEGGHPTQSMKAVVAAMYWYDLAIHYDPANRVAKERRRVLGGVADQDIMMLYRRFSRHKDNPLCLPQDVFEG